MWAYFTLKMGWLKTNAGTNIGPQNSVYLSALGIHISSSAPEVSSAILEAVKGAEHHA